MLVAKAVIKKEEADIKEELGGFMGIKRQEVLGNPSGLYCKYFYIILQFQYLAALWEEV